MRNSGGRDIQYRQSEWAAPGPAANTVATVVGAILLAGGTAGIAEAQQSEATPSPAPAGALEEIVITAQFREENVQDTPIAITALSAEAIAERNLTNIAEAANRVPNVYLAPAAQGFGQSTSVFIRGIGQADPHFAVEPGVGMYIDDVYYGVLTGSVFELLDLDRVEVLRGPQGTLAGKNSIGGAIKLFSKAPGPDADAYVEAGYGRFDRITARGASSMTLSEGKLYARIAAGTILRNGYMDRLDYPCVSGQTASGTQRLGLDCKIGEQGGKDVWSARGSLRWIIGERADTTLAVDVTEDNSDNPPGKLLVQSSSWAGSANYVTGPRSYTTYETYDSQPTGRTPRPSSFRMPDRSPLDAWGISNTLNVSLAGNLQLSSITGFREAVTVFSQQIDGSPASLFDQLWRLSHEQFTQELRLSGDVGEFMEWTAGLYYYDAEGFSSGRINLPGGLQLGGGGLNLEIFLSDPVETRSESAFLHAVFHPTRRLSLTTGLRYTDDLKEFTFNRLDANLNPHPTLGQLLDFTGTYRGDTIDWRVAADYEWTDDFMTYLQVATGHKGGGVNPRPFFLSQVLPFDPEKLTTYEIGFKSDLLDRRLRVNASAYYSDYTDIQLNLVRCDQFSPFPGAPCAMTANVGDARLKGVELETTLNVTQGLSLDVSGGYTDFQYTRIGQNVAVRRDMENVYTPDLTLAAGAQYRFNLGNGSTISTRLDYTYRSEIYTEAVNAPTNLIDGIGLVNLRVSLTDPDSEWEAAVAVTNLADEFYYMTKYDRAAAPNFAIWAQPGPPREWQFLLRRSF